MSTDYSFELAIGIKVSLEEIQDHVPPPESTDEDFDLEEYLADKICETVGCHFTTCYDYRNDAVFFVFGPAMAVDDDGFDDGRVCSGGAMDLEQAAALKIEAGAIAVRLSALLGRDVGPAKIHVTWGIS